MNEFEVCLELICSRRLQQAEWQDRFPYPSSNGRPLLPSFSFFLFSYTKKLLLCTRSRSTNWISSQRNFSLLSLVHIFCTVQANMFFLKFKILDRIFLVQGVTETTGFILSIKICISLLTSQFYLQFDNFVWSKMSKLYYLMVRFLLKFSFQNFRDLLESPVVTFYI